MPSLVNQQIHIRLIQNIIRHLLITLHQYKTYNTKTMSSIVNQQIHIRPIQDIIRHLLITLHQYKTYNTKTMSSIVNQQIHIRPIQDIIHHLLITLHQYKTYNTKSNHVINESIDSYQTKTYPSPLRPSCSPQQQITPLLLNGQCVIQLEL